MMTSATYIHVLTSIETEASGPTYSVSSLAHAQAAQGMRVGIYSLSDDPSGEVRNNVRYRSFARSSGRRALGARLEASRTLAEALDLAAADSALLHVHGLWRMPNVYPGRAAKRHGVPLVLSPRGMLSRAALSFSPIQKKAFWHIVQASAAAAVTCYHATSEEELLDIRSFGLKAPVAIIPNGIDLPKCAAPNIKVKEVLYLGRLHPKKGIDRLVAAWAQIAESHPDWSLRIVGPSELGCREELERLVCELRAPRVQFEGPLFGKEKWDIYSKAGVFVLPTLNENFGMVVAEALAAGVPAISTKGAPWQGLEAEGCGWWVDHGPDAIAAALDAALALPDIELAAMGARGRAWMARDFGWEDVAARMGQVYAWCLGQGERPDCVVTG